MDRDKNVLQCEKMSVEMSLSNGFTIHVVKARCMYRFLHITSQYDDWLKDITAQRILAKDFFYVYSEKGSDCLFSIEMAKDIMKGNTSYQ